MNIETIKSVYFVTGMSALKCYFLPEKILYGYDCISEPTECLPGRR